MSGEDVLIFVFRFTLPGISQLASSVQMLRNNQHISSVESQKGAIADQRCSVENQKGAIAIDFVQR